MFERVCVGVAVGVKPEVTDCEDETEADADWDCELVELSVDSCEMVEVIVPVCVEEGVESCVNVDVPD